MVAKRIASKVSSFKKEIQILPLVFIKIAVRTDVLAKWPLKIIDGALSLLESNKSQLNRLCDKFCITCIN